MLLHHDATDGQPCPIDNGPIRTCWYLQHNDGTTNAPADWIAWFDAIKASPIRTGFVEAGAWCSESALTLYQPPPGTQLLGYGLEQSTIGVTLSDGNLDAMTIVDPVRFRMADVRVQTGGLHVRYGLYILTQYQQGEGVILERVQVGGSPGEFSAGTVRIYNTHSIAVLNCTFWNYSILSQSPVLELDRVDGISFSQTKSHSYVSGSHVLSFINSSRIKLDADSILGSNSSGLHGRSYIHTQGAVSKISIQSGVLQSDNGNPPPYVIYVDGGSIMTTLVDATSIVQYTDAFYGGTGAWS